MVDESRAALRTTFERAAESYQRARPDYPDELFDDLVGLAEVRPGARLLEIGCATAVRVPRERADRHAYGGAHNHARGGQGASAWLRRGLLADQGGDGFSRVHAPAEPGRRTAGHPARRPQPGIRRCCRRNWEQAVRAREGRPPGDPRAVPPHPPGRRTRVRSAGGGCALFFRDSRRVVTFVACRRGEWPPRSIRDGWPVSGWVGFLLARSPRCVPLLVWVDDEPSPRRAVIPFGVRDCA